MKNTVFKSFAILFFLMCAISNQISAQIVERETPQKWEKLAYGGSFIDRFIPIPVIGPLTSDTWGVNDVIPRYINNGIEEKEWSYWGGNAILGEESKYHLFVCRWLENSLEGHGHWPKSEVVNAIADNPNGPYKVKNVIGPGHNPEMFRLADGRYVLYVIGKYYIANSINGEWIKNKFEFKKRGRRIIEGLTNLTFAQREDGSYLMVCRGGGIWFSKTGVSPYHQVSDKRVYPDIVGNFEDPVVWRTNIQYHLIVNDWAGRIAYYLRSKDGIKWKVEPGKAYSTGMTKYEDGTIEDWFKYERIKVLQDSYGRATHTFFAVIDTLKKLDKSSDNHSSKNICIPLTVGKLMTILNSKEITKETKTIRVKIKAEDGFNPNTDIDLNSLRFGASEEVNWGRGAKIISTEKSGDDLIIIFNAIGNGLKDDNFAAKLLGKTSNGKLLFAYARLPWLVYLEPALSVLPPVFSKQDNGFKIEVEVQNFGQVASQKAILKIFAKNEYKEKEIASTSIPSLKPFEKTVLVLNSKEHFEKSVAYNFNIIIKSDNIKDIEFKRIITPFE